MNMRFVIILLVAVIVAALPAQDTVADTGATPETTATPPVQRLQNSENDTAAAAKSSVRNLEEIVVEAEKKQSVSNKKPVYRSVAKSVATPVHDRFRTPNSSAGVEVYTEEDIQAMQPSDIYNVFERAPGMTIARQGSRIHNWVSGRGGEKSALGIVLDGVYVPATAAQRVLGDIPMEMIESIRIIRDASIMTIGPTFSPGSSTGGSGNQGFIIITTKRNAPGDETSGQGTVGYGSYNTLKLGAFYGNSFDSTAYVSLGCAKNRNDSRVDRDGDWHNGYDGNTFLYNMGLYRTGPVSADLSIFYNQAKRDIQRYQDEDGTLLSAYWTYDPINTRQASLSITGMWSPTQITSLSAGYVDATGTQYGDEIDSAGIITRAKGRESKDRAVEGNLFHTWIASPGKAKSNVFKAGFQMLSWYQLTEGRTAADACEENIFGFYIADEFSLNKYIDFDAGYRVDKRYIVNGGEKYIADSTVAKVAEEMWGGDAGSFSLGSSCNFTENYTLSFRFGINNTPTPALLSTKGNKTLDPEFRYKYEIGGNAIVFRWLGFTATGYYYNITNQKVQAVDSGGKGITIMSTSGDQITVFDATGNIARYGMELVVFGKGLGPLGYNVGYTLLRCDSAALNEKIPGWKFNAGLTFEKGGFSASFDALKIPEYSSSSDMPVGDYLVFNAAASQQVTPHVRISLHAKNFTDENYSTNFKGGRWKAMGYYYDIGALYGIDLAVTF